MKQNISSSRLSIDDIRDENSSQRGLPPPLQLIDTKQSTAGSPWGADEVLVVIFYQTKSKYYINRTRS